MSWSCPICRQPGRRTTEHVYPKWVSRLLGIDESKVMLFVGQERGWQAVGIGVTVNVCAACNTGWMHALEESVSPIIGGPILGHPREFSAGDQRIMALWAIKVATLLEVALQSVRGVGYAPQGVFDHLRLEGVPGAGQRVWIGAVNTDRSWPAWTSSSTLEVGPSEHRVRPQGYLAAFLVGHLLFQVLAQDVGAKNEVVLGPIPDRVLRPIWPVSLQTIAWPTKPILQPEQLDQIWPPTGQFNLR